MKTVLIEYLIRLSIIWSILLVYYQVFLASNHNWRLRRGYLLFTYLLGICIPLLPALALNALPPALPNLQIAPGIIFEAPVQAVASGAVAAYSPVNFIFLIYGLGVLFSLLKLLSCSIKIWHWKRQGHHSRFGRYTLIEHQTIPSPFAGWGAIFLPQQLEEELQSVACLHEAAHLQSHHNLERFPLVLGQILFWFHPLQWYYTHCLVAVQEFQADEAVLQHIPTKRYGHILIQQSMLPLQTWQAGLFASPLKQRINMMVNKKHSRPWRLPQLGIFVALLGLLVFSCSDLISTVQEYDDVISYIEADQVPVLVTSDETTAPKSPIDRTFLESVYRNIKYPATARKGGLEGSVVARFIITEEGKLNVSFLNTREGTYAVDKFGTLKFSPVPTKFDASSPDQDEIVVVGYGTQSQDEASTDADMEILVKEVQRVIGELPDWKPAMKDGKAIPVAMHLEVRFKLE